MNQRDEDVRRWIGATDDELVVTNLEQAPKELTRRLKDSILEQQRATNRLTKWLIVLTIAIFLLTAVMAAGAIREIINYYSR